MAGKRQHYMPRLLQRGFLADPAFEAERTWLHRPGSVARLVGIRDVGVEDWFYSRKSLDGLPTLDDAITEYEGELSATIRVLREAPPGTYVDGALAAETLVHFVFRAAHLRSIMTAGVAAASNGLEALFTDPSRLGAMLGLAGPALSSVVTSAIQSKAGELVEAGFPSSFTERLMTFLVREVGSDLVAKAVEQSGPMFAMINGMVADKARETHNAMVEKPLDENGWVEALAGFIWSVEAATDLILPDAIALSRKGYAAPLEPLVFTSAGDASVVMMPVSHDRMLVGRRSKAVPVDLTKFNAEAASSCESFFIASRSFDSEGLNSRIGVGPSDAISSAIAEAVREAEQTRSIGVPDIPAAMPREMTHQNFTYSVKLADFGDDILAREYADIIQAVVSSLSRDLPLHDLDGVTIAYDYHGALKAVDRGDPSLPPISSGALGYGIGVAKSVTVWRDGHRKEHLVIAAGLAEYWTSEDMALRASGLHILIKMLAGTAQATRYADAYSTGFSPDQMGRELHTAVATAPSGYWSAKQAAFIDPQQGAALADLVINGLDFAENEIADARSRMRDSSDIDEATMRAIQCVTGVLDHVADWLGHRDGLTDGQVFDGSDLPDRLKARGLEHWIEMFGRDLAACYPPDGSLDISVVTTLSRHVERILWSLGIYCWPQADGMHCIVTDRRFVIPSLVDGGGMLGTFQPSGQ